MNPLKAYYDWKERRRIQAIEDEIEETECVIAEQEAKIDVIKRLLYDNSTAYTMPVGEGSISRPPLSNHAVSRLMDELIELQGYIAWNTIHMWQEKNKLPNRAYVPRPLVPR